jgi:hypothetical protein
MPSLRRWADKLTAAKDYDKVDEVYQTLIANGRRSQQCQHGGPVV